VFKTSLRSSKLTLVVAPVRSCVLFLGVSGDLLWWTMEMAAVRMAGLAATCWVCLRELSTQRCGAHLTFLRASGLLHAGPFIVDRGWEGA